MKDGPRQCSLAAVKALPFSMGSLNRDRLRIPTTFPGWFWELLGTILSRGLLPEGSAPHSACSIGIESGSTQEGLLPSQGQDPRKQKPSGSGSTVYRLVLGSLE